MPRFLLSHHEFNIYELFRKMLVSSLSLLLRQPIIWRLVIICLQDIIDIERKPMQSIFYEALRGTGVLFCKKCNVDTWMKPCLALCQCLSARKTRCYMDLHPYWVLFLFHLLFCASFFCMGWKNTDECGVVHCLLFSVNPVPDFRLSCNSFQRISLSPSFPLIWERVV